MMAELVSTPAVSHPPGSQRCPAGLSPSCPQWELAQQSTLHLTSTTSMFPEAVSQMNCPSQIPVLDRLLGAPKPRHHRGGGGSGSRGKAGLSSPAQVHLSPKISHLVRGFLRGLSCPEPCVSVASWRAQRGGCAAASPKHRSLGWIPTREAPSALSSTGEGRMRLTALPCPGGGWSKKHGPRPCRTSCPTQCPGATAQPEGQGMPPL